MGTKLLLLYVICQMLITNSLGGITLPSSEFIGKVTPIKPKPLSPSTISSLSSSSSSRACENNNQWFSSPASGAREFSSPLVFTSTSRALPVPKIDSASLSDVKIPERLREKFVLPKLCCTSTGKTKPLTSTPEVKLPNKYPLLSSSPKPSNALPCHSSWDMYASSLNTVSSLSSIKPSPIIPAESLNSRSTEGLCSISKINYIIEPSAVKLTRFRTTDSLPPLEAGTPSLPEQFSSNTFCPSRSSCSLPDPIRYKSTYLPRVQTPSEMPPLIFRPISYKRAGNLNCPSESSNSLVPKTLHSDTNHNSIQHRIEPYLSPYMNPFKPALIPKTIDPIQLPKQSSNAPLSKDVLMAQKSGIGKNLRSHLEGNTGSASVAFESRLKQPESTVCLCAQSDPKSSINSKPYIWVDGVPDYKVKPCTLTKINPPALQPSLHFKNSQTPPPLVPISPSSPIIDVLSNRIKSFDCSNSIDGVHIVPFIGDYVETLERLDANDLRAYQTFVDSKNIPSLEIVYSSFAPKLASYQHPLFAQECNPKPLYSPPKTPCEPIPSISSETSYFSPSTYFPSTISQTPSFNCYVNQSPSSSIGQTTSNIVSSVNDVMSSITQDILSKCKSYLDSPSSKIHQRQTYTTQSNPCDNSNYKSLQTLPILTSTVNTQSIESIINSAIVDCIRSPTIDISTSTDISSSDAACHSPEYEMFASQSLPILYIPEPTVAVLPATSLITYSSPQLCPSYLSSPILPSYPIISSPFYMEAPVFKVGSSKKDSDSEKLIELMLIADILNNDENFDWDDLDTLLAFLSLS